MNDLIFPFAYLFFHLSILITLVVAKGVYRPLHLPSVKKYFAAILIASLPLLILDMGVTGLWWDFNPEFLVSNIRLFRIPVEEWIFFLLVPYALLVLHHNIQLETKLFSSYFSSWLSKFSSLLFLQVLFLILFIGTVPKGWWYTAVMAVMMVAVLERMKRIKLFLSTGLLIMIGFLLLTTLLFNSYLTALPVVVYNSIYKSGVMVGPIPVEDFLFGLVLYLHVAVQYEISKQQ